MTSMDHLDPYFPGIRLFDSEFSLSPPSSQSPIAAPWGFPLAPAVFPGASWDDAPGFPSGLRVRVALSKLLRTAIKPDVKANLLTFQQRVDDLLERGPGALQVRFPLLLWPEASTVPPTDLPSQGWVSYFVYFLNYFFSFCPTSLALQILSLFPCTYYIY